MLISFFFLLMAIACFWCLSDYKSAVIFVVLIGFLQDPVRKIIAGEPVLMTIMAGVVVACLMLRYLLDSKKTILEPFSAWSGFIASPLNIYLMVIFAQGVHSLVRYGSFFLTVLGAIFYVAPLIAIVVGYFQFQKFNVIRSFLWVFSILAFIVCLSVLASFLGVQSDLLDEVGSGLIIYDQGTILKAHSGFMRSSEIAAWHIGACVCFIIILVADKGVKIQSMLALIVVMLLLSAIILTGRRKMILQIIIFATLYFPVLKYFQGKLSSKFVSLAIISLVLVCFAYWFMPSFEGTQYDLYIARGVSVFGDAGKRFSTLGLGSIQWAFNIHGFFGGGLGVATQGSQHFFEGNITGASEGGVGKLISELGLISLVFIAWLSIAFLKHIHLCLKMVADLAPEKLLFVVGIFVFLVSNIPTFIVASQVFGDVFVLLILGLLAGSLFGLPKQVSEQLKQPQSQG